MVNNNLNCSATSSFQMFTNNVSDFDENSKSELLSHIQLLLSSLGFQKSANSLVDELQENGLVPKRYNINGVPCDQTYNEYLKQYAPFAGNLMGMLKRLNELSNQSVPPVIGNLPIRLFASKRQALNRKNEVLISTPRTDQILCRRPVIASMEKIDSIRLLAAREFGGQMPPPWRLMLRKESLEELKLHKRIFGHLGPIFCVKFDATGRYIFTGADDNLIKIWDARTCLLRYTFRGHMGYIMDIAVSPENNILASGSMDKTVRLWCLQRGKLLHVHKGHTASINTISFLPFMKGDTRYLVSAGSDCTVIFYRYEAPNNFCNVSLNKFNERKKPGSRFISLCHSPGGNLVVLGDTHQFITVYQVSEHSVDRLFEICAHTDRVDSLVWAHKALRFVSGSKDGTAKAWFIGEKGWSSTTFKVARNSVAIKNSSPPTIRTFQRFASNGVGGYSMQTVHNAYASTSHGQLQQNKKNTYRVTMLCWTLNDDIVVSSGSDNLLRTWNWKTGDALRILSGHTDEAFVLLAHPIYHEVIISVGHDAKLMIWNIYTGKLMKKHLNQSDGTNEKRAIFDMSISNDGTSVTFVDNYGHLSIMGVNTNGPAEAVPQEQFFNTDYRSFIVDNEGFVLDESSGLAPHNMEPPVFVSSDGAPHDDVAQRMVPGNDALEPGYEHICPWVNRQIVPEFSTEEHEQIIGEWESIFNRELRKIENSPNFLQIQEINSDNRELVPRVRKPRVQNSKAAERLAHIEQMRNHLLNQPPGLSSYIIDDDDDSDDDSSYNVGDDDDHERRLTPVTLRSTSQSVLDDEEEEETVEWESEYEAPQAPTTSMRLRANNRRRQIIEDDETDNQENSSSQGTNNQNNSTGLSPPVRRSSRRAIRNVHYATLSPPLSDLNQVQEETDDAATTSRRTRSVRTKKKNVRKTSTSSRENTTTNNENEPCCSQSLSIATTQSTVELLKNADDTNDSSDAEFVTSNELNALSTDTDAKLVNNDNIQLDSGNETVVGQLVSEQNNRDLESSAGEECHESDNTYKDEYHSSHNEDEEDEEEEKKKFRSSRKIRRPVCYSPSDRNFIDDRTDRSSPSTPSSSSSCYSSVRKTKRIARRGRPPVADRSVKIAIPAAVKRKARVPADANINVKRPRRAAADNARNRFRQSSDYDDEKEVRPSVRNRFNFEMEDNEGESAAGNSANDEGNEASPTTLYLTQAHISSSDENDVENVPLKKTRNPTPRRTPSRHVSHLPERTRTGRRVRLSVRYRESDDSS